jgi:hypothetical protein
MSFALLGERPQKVPSVTVGPTPTYRVGPLIRNGQPTAHCFEFLRWAVEFHRPYWLTTRDAHGQHTGILRAFRHAVGSPELPAEIETLLRAVRPTEWFGSKITGVDLASDFVWIDDAPLRAEIETLRGLGLLNRLLVVDTDEGLLRAADAIQGRSFRDRG